MQDRETSGGLAALQARFFRLVTSPLPVDRAAELWAPSDPAAGRPEEWVVARDRPEALGRLAIYANMYFHRLLEVLREDYPVLAARVGPAHFRNLIVDYLAAHPPDRPSLRHLGRHLPGFLRAHPLAERFPEGPDLAELERARGDRVDGPDAAALSPADLASLPPDRWPGLRLQRVPASEILRLGHPVHLPWRAFHEGTEAPARLEPEPARIAVWRSGHVVHHRVIDEPEAVALERLAQAATVAELAALAEAQSTTVQDSGRVLAGWLRRWITDGLLRPGEPAQIS